MRNKRLLTIDDLYEYFTSTKTENFHFNANEQHQNIIVQVGGVMTFEENTNYTDGLIPVTLQACHTGNNKNHSYISEKTMNAALPSFANRPILGYIHEVNGQPQFYTHNMHIDENDEIVYDEYPVGIIPESGNPHLEYDEQKEKTYVVVNGYIFEEYSKASEILEREGSCSCSVELSIRDLSYSAKDKILNIEDFFLSGVTILGQDQDGNEIAPGMEGANITISDFSEQNNSVFSRDDKLIETLEKLNITLSNFNIDRKEDRQAMNDFDVEIKVEETEELEPEVEEIDNETESEEEEIIEENAETEEFDEAVEEPVVTDEMSEDEVPEESEEQKAFDGEPTEEETNTDETSEDEPDYAVATEDGDNNAKLSYEYTVSNDGKIRTFSVSLSQIAGALNALVNDMYSESDNTWYYTEVYPDDKTVVMIDGWSGAAYRQSYKVRNDIYSLVGERVAVHACYLTDDEEKRLDDMKSNYARFEEVSEKLSKYESEPDKMEILNSADYANISDMNEFVELKKMDKHFDMSVDEVKRAADDMLLEFAKGNKLSFAANPEEPKKDFFAFARIEHKTDFLDGLLNKNNKR